MPMSPKPPSANWLETIRPLLVASLVEAVVVDAVGVPPGATGATGPAGGVVAKPGCDNWPNCFEPVVIEPTLASCGWISRPLCCVATRPPTVTFSHCMPISPNPPSATWLDMIEPVFVPVSWVEKYNGRAPVKRGSFESTIWYPFAATDWITVLAGMPSPNTAMRG